MTETVAAQHGLIRESGQRGQSLVVNKVSKSFIASDRALAALDDVSVTVRDGEFVSLVGPSGCGKSTLFNIIAGLEEPSSGSVAFDGDPAATRLGRVGYMLQKDLLLPWKTVLDNTALGLQYSGKSRREARAEALKWFGRFGLEGFEDQYPAVLSGGMRQRAALLRTVLAGKSMLLLDEPFGALDALTRLDMHEWLMDIWSSLVRTVLFVTHDVDEAIYLSDRVYVMSRRPGTIVRTLHVPFERPRKYGDVAVSPEFGRLKAETLHAMREEVRA